MSYRDYLLLEHENIPCWYELSFDSNIPAIIVSVHTDFLQKLSMSLDDSFFTKNFLKTYNFSRFNGDFTNGNFGFEEVFKRIDDKNNFIRFQIEIPVLEKEVMKVCSNCGGSKNDLFGICSSCNGSGIEKEIEICSYCKGEKIYFSDTCFNCHGEGKKVKTILDWPCFNAIAATFCVFFKVMSQGQNKEKVTLSHSPQLLLVESHISQETKSSPLNGTYSIPLINWLKNFPQHTTLVEVEEAMKKTCEKIQGKSYELMRQGISARVAYQGGWLNISCPGDRSGIHPESGWSIKNNQGYKFYCHNVDTPAQQLMLIAALAALHDKARKEIT